MTTLFEKALKGHFYAVGVGPGSPDLITLRAARLVETCDVIIAPRSERADDSQSLKTVAELLKKQEVLDMVYPMERDAEKTDRFWKSVADVVAEKTRAGKSVVQVTIGDPLIYSTSCYLLGFLRELLQEDRIHVVPGISAFQASASLLGEALTLQEDRLTLMPATDLDEVEKALSHCETLVLYKAAKRLKELATLLERKGLTGKTRVVCYAEQNGRQIVAKNIQEALDRNQGYMTTVIVRVGSRAWRQKK